MLCLEVSSTPQTMKPHIPPVQDTNSLYQSVIKGGNGKSCKNRFYDGLRMFTLLFFAIKPNKTMIYTPYHPIFGGFAASKSQASCLWSSSFKLRSCEPEPTATWKIPNIPKIGRLMQIVVIFRECPDELYFFSLLNCNTQIRTPTRGLRKPLLPSKTAYARVTFQEVPTRLPPRKLLQRSLYLT